MGGCVKASELIVQLQAGIDEGRDWEVVHPETHLPVNLVQWVMPSLSDREDFNAQPYVVVTQDPNRGAA